MQNSQDIEARGHMLLGAHLAGAAIETSMLGATHATANPLSAHFDVVHGIAVGVMLPHVIRWNTPEVGHLYRELALSVGWADRRDSEEKASEALADGFAKLLEVAKMPVNLTQALQKDIDDDLLHTLATEASQQWTGTFNPRRMDADAFRQLYRNAM